ncbi:Strigolactone receptor KAI2d8 [Castilleja foliolosa]|uniref:Strigolactone receptor KAI2d8 n=1 Tax=Castilleja foliolosa TaxID=1961234 RepID=A0ABD3DF32_9LAMI
MSKVGAAHNVRVLGSGKTTIVLGHGFGTDQSVWRHLVPHLVDQYRVLLYDNMGAGTTNADHYDFDRYSTTGLEGHVSDLITILDEFNVGKCIFVGHSLSPLAAMIASISRPDMFHKVIILSSTPRDVEHCGLQMWTRAGTSRPVSCSTGWKTNYKTTIRGMPKFAIGSDSSVAVQEFTQMLESLRPDITLSTIRALHKYDVRPLLSQVTVPCHIIHSSKDNGVPVAAAEYLHQHLGGKSVLEVMPVEGHLPHLSSPEITNQVLLRHIHLDIADRA